MEVFLWQSGLSLATKQDQQHSGRFQIGLLKWIEMDGNWRFIFQILLRAVAKQKYGYPILWIFLGFTIEDIASSGQAPTFHEHNLSVVAEN